jgi:hypothetical protein
MSQLREGNVKIAKKLTYRRNHITGINVIKLSITD